MATKHRPTRSSVSAKKTATKPARPGGGSVKSARPAAGTPRASSKKTTTPAAARPQATRRQATARAQAARNPQQLPRQPRSGEATPLKSAVATVVGPPAPSPAPLPPPPEPTGPSSHDLAVEVFERGFRALQQREFQEAARLFSSIFEEYPDEKELQERARVYLAICERQSGAQGAREPRTVEERINAATVSFNRGAYDEGLKHLQPLEAGHGENDHLHYMLAVAHAALGDPDMAIRHLRLAVELNADNHYLARQDADLDPLRSHPDFVALLQSPPPRQRPTSRARSGR